MADEIVHDAPEAGAEVTDLRSTIVAAVEKQRTPEPEPELALEVKPDVKDAKPDKPETEAARNERLRDEQGRFAKGEDPKPDADIAKPADGAEVPKLDADDAKSALRPPPGWSPTAKVAFDKLPPEVQQAVAKREEEVNNGFAKLSEYKPIDRFMEMARAGGTTLDKALDNYVGIENAIRQDIVSGVARICQNQNVHPVALANAILARHGVSPTQIGEPGETPQVRQQAPGVDPAVLQRMNALEQEIQQQRAERERLANQGVQSEIQRFASDPKHTFFENVKVDMGRLMTAGMAEDLEDAYDKACHANKEIRALLIKQQTAPSANAADAVQKAKAAAKATGGAPSAGFKPNPGTEGAPLRETIVAAVRAQRGL
jgi:hypothetical protein